MRRANIIIINALVICALHCVFAVSEGSCLQNNEFLVMFHHYYNVTEHEDLLFNKILGSRYDSNCIKIIPRDNLSTRLYPSDFALVQLTCATTDAIEEFKRHEYVKYVIPHKKSVNKLNGRLHTKLVNRKLSQISSTNSNDNNRVDKLYKIQQLWDLGVTGKNIHVAVFDTGVMENVNGINNIEEIINYTNEESMYDNHGHGTFVTSIIASNCVDESKCCKDMKGIAYDSHLHIFKVFTSEQVSYTSWFLDAFNYALQKKIHVLNLSIGGPDYMDMPFVDKVRELAANNIIVVSAIGNDGPLYGTLNNPADLSYVIGIGAHDSNLKIAPFSSRGMTLYELNSGGYGRMKPDFIAHGVRINGYSISAAKCQKLSGTSVASPVVTGIIALLLSASHQLAQPSKKTCLNLNEVASIMNPASMKQILAQSSTKVNNANLFEQGIGRIDVMKAYNLLKKEFEDYFLYKRQLQDNSADPSTLEDSNWPRAMFHPSNLDLTDCPYMWPYCAQPLYYSQMPIIVNVTILNGISLYGYIDSSTIEYVPVEASHKDILNVEFSYNTILFPWTGHLGVKISVNEKAKEYSGTISGHVKLTLHGKVPGFEGTRFQEIELFLKVQVVPTPDRSKRLLFDSFHQLTYPTAAYVPKDDLSQFTEANMNHNVVDWNGDHLHTNFLQLFNLLIRRGYHIEILNSGDFTSFDANDYSTLIIVDPEDEFTSREAIKLQDDINNKKLNLVVFADWYNEYVIRKLKFLDDNTQTIWFPITGGSNVPALNGLLHKYGIMLGDVIYNGEVEIESEKVLQIGSGTSITRWPKNGELLFAELNNQTPNLLLPSSTQSKKELTAILGIYQPESSEGNSGRIAVYGDSNCVDMVSKIPASKMCYWLMEDLLAYLTKDVRAKWMNSNLVKQIDTYYSAPRSQHTAYSKVVPQRVADSPLPKYSRQPAEELIASFNSSTWPYDSLDLTNSEDDASLAGEENAGNTSVKKRVIPPVMFVFLLLVLLIYLSFTRHRSMVGPERVNV